MSLDKLTSCSAFEYTYLLFWNSFWTIAPVLGIGLFDRIVGRWFWLVWYSTYSPSDADVLMAFPELYRYGRERTWFSLKLFFIYMIDGVVQACYIVCRLLGANHSSSPFRYISLSPIHISPPRLVPTAMAFSCTSTVR